MFRSVYQSENTDLNIPNFFLTVFFKIPDFGLPKSFNKVEFKDINRLKEGYFVF